MYNYYREQWLIDRLADTLAGRSAHRPCVDSLGGVGQLAVLTVEPRPGVAARARRDLGGRDRPAPAPATDDHPFPYLRTPTHPRALPGHARAHPARLAASLVRVARGPLRPMLPLRRPLLHGRRVPPARDQERGPFALLFGTTWFVNALGVRRGPAAVLAAVEVSRRVTLPRPRCSMAPCSRRVAVACFVPPSAAARPGAVPRFAAARARVRADLPRQPRLLPAVQGRRRRRPSAFGANLLGAMVGGLLEYAALVTGYRASGRGRGPLRARVRIRPSSSRISGSDGGALTSWNRPDERRRLQRCSRQFERPSMPVARPIPAAIGESRPRCACSSPSGSSRPARSHSKCC